MDEGLLWFDNDPRRDLAEKVIRAAKRYRKKYGTAPNVCYVHPSVMESAERKIDGLRVAPLPAVLKHHFWLGQERAR